MTLTQQNTILKMVTMTIDRFRIKVNMTIKGLRKVKPYNFNFLFYTKVRMYGATVLNTFLREYRGRTEGYYVRRKKNHQK